MTIDTDNTADTGTPPAGLVENLTFRYRSLDDEPETKHYKTATPEIEDISFSLPAGELMLIAGPSGCGKSTLLKCLNGLIPNSYHGTLGGQIQLGGRSINGLIGFIAGLAMLVTWGRYNNSRNILIAEVFAAVGIVVGIGFAAYNDIWISKLSFATASIGELLPAAGSDLINGLILLPILLVAYNAAVRRFGRA